MGIKVIPVRSNAHIPRRLESASRHEITAVAGPNTEIYGPRGGHGIAGRDLDIIAGWFLDNEVIYSERAVYIDNGIGAAAEKQR